MDSTAPLYDLPSFAALLPVKGRLIGLDVGDKTIGVALTDERRQIATPQFTVERRQWKLDAEALAKVISPEVVGCVIGYPVNMDGTPGGRAQTTRSFARSFREKFNLPILMWDERLSTVAVVRMMEKEADLSRARRDQLVDKLAAAYMLQGVLDGLGNK